MFRKNNDSSLFLMVLAVFIAFAIYNVASFFGLINKTSVSAYSATLSTSGSVNIDVSASGNKANVATDNLEVTSNCPLGYTLSISGPTDTALYKNGESTSSSKINPTSGTKTTPLPITGDDGSGNSYLGTWGYSMTNNAATGTFIGLNSTQTEIYTKATASGNGQSGEGATTKDTIPVYYGASVSIATEPGDYKLAESTAGAGDNVITYFLTTNPACDQYAIRYNDNGANSTTKMGNQSVNTSSDLTLWASNFKHPDTTNTNANSYGFAGWSLVQLDPNASDFKTKLAAAVSAGKVYGPNQTIPQANLQSFLDNNITIDNGAQYVDLYAIWVKSEGNIQNWTGCSAMNIGDITALKDLRDNNVYTVAKLADEKCWMVENLRLGGTTAMTMNSATTNSPISGFTLSQSQKPLSATPWCTGTTAACIDKSMLYAGNTIDTTSNMTNTNQNIYSYGNYYNWYSATAGSGTYSMSSDNAAGSICPAGWRLPNGSYNTTTSDFTVLNGIINDGGYHQYPNNFILSGWIRGTINSVGVSGWYWTNITTFTAYEAIHARVNRSSVVPFTLDTKSSGNMIRCLASDSYTITFNANTGSGTMDSQIAFVDNKTTLNPNTFTAPTGMQFAGWNTAADGSGTAYTDGAEIMNLTTANQTITLYAQWTKAPVTGYIVYDGNGNTSTFGMGNQQATGTTIELWAANYAKDGYGFAGWSETKLNPDDTNFYTNLNTAVSQNKVYGPNQTVNTSDVSGKILYAIWVPVAKNSSNTELTFQTTNLLTTTLSSFNGGGTLNNKPNGYVTALRDQRDNQVYAVAKLADGNYWMIENLRLGSNAELSNNNTNNPLLPLTNNDGSKGLSLSSSFECYMISGCATVSRVDLRNTTQTVNNMITDRDKVYSYGNYYNWYSATAGNSENLVYLTTSAGDVCPRGWHLAYGGKATSDRGGNTSGGFYYLYSRSVSFGTIAEEQLKKFPSNYIDSGFTYGLDAFGGSAGTYWSSTTRGGTDAYTLRLDGNNTNGTTESDINYGYSVRCVVKS